MNERTIRELGQAVSDVSLELFLTGGLLILLFLLGLMVGRWSLRKSLRQPIVSTPSDE